MDKKRRPRITVNKVKTDAAPKQRPKLKAKKLFTIREYFSKFELRDRDYELLGQSAMVLMKYYNYEIFKKIENINGERIAVVLYPKRILSLIYRLRGYITHSDLRTNGENYKH